MTQAVAILIATALLVIGTLQSVRTRECRLDKQRDWRKIAVWLGAGVCLTIVSGVSIWLALPALMVALIASSLVVGVATRVLWKLGM